MPVCGRVELSEQHSDIIAMYDKYAMVICTSDLIEDVECESIKYCDGRHLTKRLKFGITLVLRYNHSI